MLLAIFISVYYKYILNIKIQRELLENDKVLGCDWSTKKAVWFVKAVL